MSLPAVSSQAISREVYVSEKPCVVDIGGGTGEHTFKKVRVHFWDRSHSDLSTLQKALGTDAVLKMGECRSYFFQKGANCPKPELESRDVDSKNTFQKLADFEQVLRSSAEEIAKAADNIFAQSFCALTDKERQRIVAALQSRNWELIIHCASAETLGDMIKWKGFTAMRSVE